MRKLIQIGLAILALVGVAHAQQINMTTPAPAPGYIPFSTGYNQGAWYKLGQPPFNITGGTISLFATGGWITHKVTGSSVTVVACSEGAAGDSYEQNPLTADVVFTLPNSCDQTYDTIAYLVTQGTGSHLVTISSGAATLIIDAPGSGGIQTQIGPTAGNTLWLVFHWDAGNNAWHELGMAAFPPSVSDQTLYVYSGSGANALPVASTVAHTFACVSDAADCNLNETYAPGNGTNCHVHSDGHNWIQDGFGC